MGVPAIGDPQAVPAFTEALQDPSAEVRQQAACALGAIDSERAPPASIDALRDPAAGVRQQRRGRWA